MRVIALDLKLGRWYFIFEKHLYQFMQFFFLLFYTYTIYKKIPLFELDFYVI